MKKRDLMPSIVLATICVVVALMLAAINMITAPIIESRQNALANEALLEVLPDGKISKRSSLPMHTPNRLPRVIRLTADTYSR